MAAQFNPMTGEWEEQAPVVASTQKNPWDDPWGDESVESLGNVNLQNGGFGGTFGTNNLQLNGGGMGTNYNFISGENQYGVDSLETAKRLQKQYGGKINKGYQGGADNTYDIHTGEGSAGVDGQGWGYYYTPPKEEDKDGAISQAIGFTKQPTGLSALSDGQFAALVASLFFGGALAGGALGGAAAGAEGAAGAGALEGASAGLGAELAGSEAAMLGGSAVGTGTELTAAQMLAASEGLGLGGAGELAGFEASALGGPAVGTGTGRSR